MPFQDLPQTLYKVYEAKKAAECADGVGHEIDMAILGAERDAIMLPADLLTALEKVRLGRASADIAAQGIGDDPEGPRQSIAESIGRGIGNSCPKPRTSLVAPALFLLRLPNEDRRMSRKLSAKPIQKYPSSKIYQEDGACLFVPLPGMWDLHNLARDLRVRSWPAMPIAVLYREIKQKAPKGLRLQASIQRWSQLNREHDWYVAWLLRGQDVPAHVFIPTAKQIGRCSEAWNYTAHCRTAGVDFQTYDAWFKEQLIPDLRWLKWLYGWRQPAGCFVVGLELQRLRTEGAEEAICAGAGIPSAAVRQWRKDPTLREALERAIASAAHSGGHLPAASNWERWQQVPAQIQERIGRYAKAATWSARCNRAGFDSAKLNQALARAQQVGARELLLQYLRREGPFKQPATKSGLLADNFFVPTLAMLRFRNVPEPLAVWGDRVSFRGQVLTLNELPGFEEWFKDWTIPRKWSGGRLDLPERFQAQARAAAETVSQLNDDPNDHSATQPKERAGRPKGWRKPDAERRKREMLEAWDRGDFGTNKSAAGRQHGFHRSDASKLINAHEAAKCRK